MDIRQAYSALGLPLVPIGAVASFTDNLDGRTLVTVVVGNLSFFGVNYVIFDSYIYPDTYLVGGIDASQFVISATFSADDAGVNIYNVTALQTYYESALSYISTLACIDPLGDNFTDIVWYYALYLYSQAKGGGGGGVKRYQIGGEFTKEYFEGGSGTDNAYWKIANDYSGGCLKASLKKPVPPTISTSKTWAY